MARRAFLIGLALLGWLVATSPASAQLGLIRDAEIERTVRDLAAPLFSAAGIPPSSVSIYLVNDDRLNAFVAGGQNLFLNAGLLMRAETPEQLAGVIAHETGHIAGGHLVRISPAADRAEAVRVLGMVLGAAAAAAGAPEVGMAAMLGGQQVGQQSFLRFSRGQEQAADQAALNYLEATGTSARGLAEFFRILDDQRMLSGSRVDPYFQTHPLTRDRIEFVERQVAAERERRPLDPATVERHERMVAKLAGFMESPASVSRRYEGRDDFAARYARAIAAFRSNDAPGALRQLAALQAEEPDNPFLHELQGQILFERGRVADAVAPYRRAVDLAPREPLIRLGYGRALLETGEEAAAADALATVVQAEPSNSFAWRQLGIARGRLGEVGTSNLALAEAAVLRGEFADARLFLARADEALAEGSRERRQLNDLRVALETAEREAQRR
ncbi:MAG: M48 family metalloprotease [Pseudomonadota bacterium]